MSNPSFISALKSDRCVHYLNNTLVNRAQSIDLSANVPNSIIEELGNENHAGIITDPAEISLNVSALDTGLALTRTLTNKAAANSFSLKDFVSAQVDYVGVVRNNSDNFFRSVYVKGANISSVSYSFDASGNATESYGLSADNLTVFDGFVITKSYTILAGDVTNGYFALPVQGAELPIQTKTNSYFAGSYLLRAAKTSGAVTTELAEGNDYTYDAANQRVTAAGLKTGDIWTVVFYSAAIGTPLNPVFTAAVPAVRGSFTPVSIGVTDKTFIPRVQSASISVSFQRDRIRQLGSQKVIYAPSGPATVSGNLSVLMSDLSLRKILTYGSETSSETQFGIEQIPAFALQNGVGLEAVVKSPVDNSVLKRITVADIVTTSGGMPSSVNGTLTESYSWQGKSGGLTISNT